MDLQAIAEADLATTLEGNGRDVIVTAPNGDSAPLQAISNDIALSFDPDTGIVVSGRNANCALRIRSLTEAGLGLPYGVPDTDKKPWQIEFTTVNGSTFTTKVIESHPDRSLGLITCRLEIIA